MLNNLLNIIIKPTNTIDYNSFFGGIIVGIIGTAIIATMIIITIIKYKK